MFPGTRRVYTVLHTRVLALGVPGYQTRLYWRYSGMYPGKLAGYFGDTRVCTRVPTEYIPYYTLGCFHLGYPGTKQGYIGDTRVCTRVPPDIPYRDIVVMGRYVPPEHIPDQVILVILGYVPGYPEYVYPTKLFW